MLCRMMLKDFTPRHLLGLGATLVLLSVVYLSTLQTIPNGSSHYYMIDVGETQIVLNTWGSLHATGYPLYVILGNIFTGLMRGFGVDPVVAPALVSLLWGWLTLALLYVLILHLTRQVLLAIGGTIAFGLIRSMWIHNTIAEIYTFTTFLLLLLLILALWKQPISGRIYLLAIVGGIGVAHHRSIVMVIPALLYTTWPIFYANRGKLPRIVGISLVLGALGFLQYVYMYLRGQSDSAWVYGEPGTLEGLWIEFTGREAARFIATIDTFSTLVDNFHLVNTVILRDVRLPGLIVGGIGLLVGIYSAKYRREAITIALVAGVSYGFHVFAYSDILSALILPVDLGLVFGWVFLGVLIIERTQPTPQYAYQAAVGGIFAIICGVLFAQNNTFITKLTTDPTGLETIEQIRNAPQDSTVMLAWGPRHFAVGIAQELQDDLTHVNLVDHKADFATIAESSTLITPEYSFYNQPVVWWQARLQQPVYLQTIAPYLVEIRTEPSLTNTTNLEGVQSAGAWMRCEPGEIDFYVIWQAGEAPTTDLSVFVHALDENGTLLAQGDQTAPVYGWRPLTTWLAEERLQDVYPIHDPAVNDAREIRYGLYRILPEGGFENVYEQTTPVICDV